MSPTSNKSVSFSQAVQVRKRQTISMYGEEPKQRAAELGSPIIRVLKNQYNTGDPAPKELPKTDIDYSKIERPNDKKRKGFELYADFAHILK